MIIFGVTLPEPEFNNLDTYDLRIVNNRSLDNKLTQAKLNAAVGNTQEWILRFIDCEDEKQALLDGFRNTAARPISVVTLGESVFGVVLDADISFTEDREDLWTLTLTMYVLDKGTFSPLLDPDDEWITDPDNQPIEGTPL